eukprot:sb/3465741/
MRPEDLKTQIIEKKISVSEKRRYLFQLEAVTPLYCYALKSQSRKKLLLENLGRAKYTPAATTQYSGAPYITRVIRIFGVWRRGGSHQSEQERGNPRLGGHWPLTNLGEFRDPEERMFQILRGGQKIFQILRGGQRMFQILRGGQRMFQSLRGGQMMFQILIGGQRMFQILRSGSEDVPDPKRRPKDVPDPKRKPENVPDPMRRPENVQDPEKWGTQERKYPIKSLLAVRHEVEDQEWRPAPDRRGDMRRPATDRRFDETQIREEKISVSKKRGYLFQLEAVTPLYCYALKSQSRKKLLLENLGRAKYTPAATTQYSGAPHMARLIRIFGVWRRGGSHQSEQERGNPRLGGHWPLTNLGICPPEERSDRKSVATK